MDKIRQVMKADALSILGDPDLVAELEQEEQRRLKKKAKGGMVLKADKGIEMEVEVEFRPFGGATSISEALEYIANLDTARDIEREIRESISIFDGVIENVMADKGIEDKKVALRGILAELKQLLEEDRKVSKSDFYLNPNVLTLAGALRDFKRRYPNYIPPRGMLLRKVARNISDSTMVRDKARTFDALVAEAQADILATGLIEKPVGFQSAKGTFSAREAANLNSGLNKDGTPIVIEKSKAQVEKEFYDAGIQRVVDAIERSRPQIIEKATIKKGSVRYWSLLNSGVNPENGSILF